MPVPSSIVDLSTVAASNSPQDSDVGSSSNGPDDYFRAHAGILKRMFSQGADITIAATIPLPSEGAFFYVIGGTTVTGMATSYVGRFAFLSFQNAATLTHSSTFKLPGAANHVTSASGDIGLFVQTGVSAWTCLYLLKADGTILAANDATTIANTALSTANTASSTATAANATANAASTAATNATTTANAASSAASSAQATATSAAANASTAVSTANSAASSAASTSATLSTHTADNTRHISAIHGSAIDISGGISRIKVDIYGRVTYIVTDGGGSAGSP